MSEHIEDHERIEELLAAHALRALSPEDAAEAERLLREHVPTCERCRASVADFAELEGELALAARPVQPPDLLLRRLRNDVDPRPLLPRRRSALGWTAAVAAAVAVGLATWNTVALDNRVSRAEDREQRMAGALNVATDPQAQTVQLDSKRLRPRKRLTAAYVPGRQEMSIFGSEVPDPRAGDVYRLWLIRPGGATSFVGSFHPDGGIVVLRFQVDLAGYSGMLISEEGGPIGREPAGTIRWATRL